MKYQRRKPSTMICFAVCYTLALLRWSCSYITSQDCCTSHMPLFIVIALSIRHTCHRPQARLRRTLFAPSPNPPTAPASSAHTAKSVHSKKASLGPACRASPLQTFRFYHIRGRGACSGSAPHPRDMHAANISTKTKTCTIGIMVCAGAQVRAA